MPKYRFHAEVRVPRTHVDIIADNEADALQELDELDWNRLLSNASDADIRVIKVELIPDPQPKTG